MLAEVNAQNFEADSVYYSLIPREPQKPTKKTTLLRIFKDTTRYAPRFQYFFNVQVGPVIGDDDHNGNNDITFTTSTLHGITLGRKLRAGIGLGFDSYDSWQSTPLYGSVSWDLLGTKNTQALFAQFDYGWSKAWKQRDDTDFDLADSKGGKMYNALIGYRIKYHKLKIGLSVGSKFQQVYAYYEYPTYYYTVEGIIMEGSPTKKTIQKDMKRLILSLVIGWN